MLKKNPTRIAFKKEEKRSTSCMLFNSMSTIPLATSFQHIALQAKNMVEVVSPSGSIEIGVTFTHLHTSSSSVASN